MAAINRAAANSNKRQVNGQLPFPDQGNAIANASKYSGREGALKLLSQVLFTQTMSNKY